MLSGAETVPGQPAPSVPAVARSKALPPAREAPAPPSPSKDPGLSLGFLETTLPEADPESVVFQVCLSPRSSHPAAIVFPLWHLLLDVPELQHCSPGALSGPLRLSPAPDPSGFTRTQKTGSALSLRPVLSSAVKTSEGSSPLPTKDSVRRNPRYRPGLTPNSPFVSFPTHTLV